MTTEKPAESDKRPMKARFGTPEEQKQIDDYRANLGKALVANLNRNVLAQTPPPKKR